MKRDFLKVENIKKKKHKIAKFGEVDNNWQFTKVNIKTTTHMHLDEQLQWCPVSLNASNWLKF